MVGSDDIFVGLFTPKDAEQPREGPIVYPEGDLFFLHGISPIGTFTLPSDQLGPQGQPNAVSGTFEGEVSMYFGDPATAG